MAYKCNFILLTVFVMVALASSVNADERWGFGQSCANNEEYTLCGSRCPVTCANLAAPPSCKGCTKGCFCKQGFFKNTAGACVLAANC